MIQSLSGTSLKWIAPLESKIYLLSTGTVGSVVGREPTEINILVALMSWSLPSCPTICTLVLDAKPSLPLEPGYFVFFLNKPSIQ